MVVLAVFELETLLLWDAFCPHSSWRKQQQSLGVYARAAGVTAGSIINEQGKEIRSARRRLPRSIPTYSSVKMTAVGHLPPQSLQ